MKTIKLLITCATACLITSCYTVRTKGLSMYYPTIVTIEPDDNYIEVIFCATDNSHANFHGEQMPIDAIYTLLKYKRNVIKFHRSRYYNGTAPFMDFPRSTYHERTKQEWAKINNHLKKAKLNTLCGSGTAYPQVYLFDIELDGKDIHNIRDDKDIRNSFLTKYALFKKQVLQERKIDLVAHRMPGFFGKKFINKQPATIALNDEQIKEFKKLFASEP